MLTFLRKIRKSLVETGSVRKYTLYALGEIALVVIGILIALQVSNWNDNRKNIKNQEIHRLELLRSLYTDVHNDISAIERVTSTLKYQAESTIKVMQYFEDSDAVILDSLEL